MNFRRFTANSLWVGSGMPAFIRYRKALKSPETTQTSLLKNILFRNQNSEYGRRYQFQHIKSVNDFQAQIPIVDFDLIDSEIEKVKDGKTNVLTAEPVLMMEKTSGTTTGAKYIPFTASLREEFKAAIGAWMADLYMHHPSISYGSSYWSISPIASESENTSGGLRVGFQDDSEYFGEFQKRWIRKIMAVPPEIAHVASMENARYLTMRFLLEDPDLTFVSVWNPTFLTLLMKSIDGNIENIISDIRDGEISPPFLLNPAIHKRLKAQVCPNPRRANFLSTLLSRAGTLATNEVWPHLSMISCWTSAAAASFIPEIQKMFPHVEIQPKGLLSTEGIVSIPMCGHPGSALAVTSHFLEFTDPENPTQRPALVHELEAGKTYSVILTTGGGLYRYATKDLVRVVGFIHATPLVEFIGRTEEVSDLCGEKLGEPWIRSIVTSTFRDIGVCPRFSMMVPELGDTPHYVLIFETESGIFPQMGKLISAIEKRMRENHHYKYCRDLGQLDPLQGVLVKNGAALYLERCVSLGQRSGNVKPTMLHKTPGWLDWFKVPRESKMELIA